MKGIKKNLESVFSSESNKRVEVEATHSPWQSTNVRIPKGEEPHRGSHESQQLKSCIYRFCQLLFVRLAAVFVESQGFERVDTDKAPPTTTTVVLKLIS